MKLSDYVRVCGANPQKYASLPLPATAEFLEVTRPAVRELIHSGKLECVRLIKDDWQRTFVTVASIVKYCTNRDTYSSDQVKRVTKILEDTAAAHKTIPYSDLMAEIGMEWRNPPNRKRIGEILGDISIQSAESHPSFMLSAIAVLKGAGRPNMAFFDLARELEMLDDDGDEDTFLEEQQTAIWRHFAKKKSKPG